MLITTFRFKIYIYRRRRETRRAFSAGEALDDSSTSSSFIQQSLECRGRASSFSGRPVAGAPAIIYADFDEALGDECTRYILSHFQCLHYE